MTQRLVGMIAHDWPTFDGWAAARNVDPIMLPYPRLLNLAYYWGTMNTDEAGLARFNARLWMPPPGEIAQGPWSAESETAAFKSLAAAVKPK